MRYAMGAGVWAVCIAAAASVAVADVAVVGAFKDNTLYEPLSGLVSNGAGEHFFVGRSGQGDARRGLVAFDLSSIPAGATVTGVDVILKLSRTAGAAGPRDVSLHLALQDWGEGTSVAFGNEGAGAPATPGDATWQHTFYNTTLWASPGGDFAAAASATLSVGDIAVYTWGSTAALVADVQGWVDDPATNFGWVVIGDESASSTAKRFDTHEAAAVDQPKLRITYTPAPPPCLGDMNCDGVVNFKDIDRFVAALGYPGGAGWPYPCPWTNADANQDGNVTFKDIDPFVAQLGHVCSAAE